MPNILSYCVVSCLIVTSACSSTASRTVEQVDDGEGGASGNVARSSGGSTATGGAGSNGLGGQASSGGNHTGSAGNHTGSGGSAGGDTQGSSGGGAFAGSDQGGSAQGGSSNQAGSSQGGATGTELSCNDTIDNDKDGKLNCSDSDCAGKLCQKQSAQKVYPTRDYLRSQGPVGASDTDGTADIAVGAGTGARDYGVIKFDNIAADSSLTINRAVLRVYFNSGDVRINVLDAAQSLLLNPDPPSTPGYREYDVTVLVKKWANGSQIDRFLTLNWGNSANGTITFRATEYAGTEFDPHLILDYEARCSSDRCPVP